MTKQRLATVASLTVAMLAAPAAWWAGASAADETSEALRLCTRGDLVGTWAVIRFGTTASARGDPAGPATRPHQRFVFEADSSLRHLASGSPITREDHRAMLAAPVAARWAIDDRGRLLVTRDGAAAPEVHDCQMLVAKVNDPRSTVAALPGDLLMTQYDANDRPIARRLLRKIARLRP
jgi:hypothetical protein